MKRFIIALFILVTLFTFTACRSKVEDTVIIPGFNTIKILNKDELGYDTYLIYDTETKAMYIASYTYNGGVTLCPYYDEMGNVAFYEGE